MTSVPSWQDSGLTILSARVQVPSKLEIKQFTIIGHTRQENEMKYETILQKTYAWFDKSLHKINGTRGYLG